jgi:hypothetical protein
MRGPADDAIETLLVGAGPAARTARDEPPPRPTGGKALLRLLQLLSTTGYESQATATIDLAVHGDAQPDFRTQLEDYVTLPGLPAAPRRTSAAARRKAAAGPEPSVSEDVAAAHMEAAAQLGPPTPTGPQWRSLGPWTIPNGQTYGAGTVNVSGRVSAITVDPSDPAHVLVGAANGGVWESRDRGGSWVPRTDFAATLAVGAVAFDPSNPRVVYCGLGEGNWWWWLGAGILRSSDGGASWTTLCTAPFVGHGFYDLVVDPADGQHLIAGTIYGVYVSTDGGVSWSQTRSARGWSIAIAAGEVLAACSDGLWRSTDGGATWSAVTLPGSPGAFTRLAVAIAPSSPSIAYAWGAGPTPATGDPTPYLWRRAGRRGWRQQPAPPGVGTGQSWYDWFLGVSPGDANTIYCGAISVHRGTLSGSTWSWLDIASKPAGDSIHPDSHAIAFEPGSPDTIYVGSDGGLYRSTNRGDNWVHRNNGLVISEFEYLAQNHGITRWLIGGTQDNGTERWTGAPTWEHVADGDGGDCGVNRATPTTVFHTYYGMSPEVSTTRGDAGSWSWIGPPVPANEGGPFYPPFECSATSGDTVAIGGNALYVSRNNGAAWTRLPYPGGGTATALGVPDADTVLVGLDGGDILKTTWTGTAWSALSALTTPRAGASVSDIHVDANAPSRVWVTYSTVGGGRVFRSDDGGANWADRTAAALPNLPITALALDPWNGNRAWVSASLGVYQTTDGGASWTDFAAGLPNAYVGDLLFHPHARVLRAGTRNRGVWEIPVDGWQTTPICGRQWVGRLAANQTQRWFTFNWPATWHVVWTVMPTTVRPGAPEVGFSVAVERASAEYATYWITVSNLTAAPVEFEGRFCILSRY